MKDTELLVSFDNFEKYEAKHLLNRYPSFSGA